MRHEDVWDELTACLEDTAHRLSGPGAAMAAHAAARMGVRSAKLYSGLARRVAERLGQLSALDCARAASGFLQGPTKVAESTVTQGPFFDRVLELGLDSFDSEALTLMLDSLGRAAPGTWGVETMAGALLEVGHRRLDEFSARQLASLARSLGVLRPETPNVLCDFLDRAQAAATAEAGDLAPRHLAMLCQGIAAQSAHVCRAPARIAELLPQVSAVLRRKTTALTVAQIMGSVARCVPSAARAEVLGECAGLISRRVHELPATALVAVSESLAATQADAGAQNWLPPEDLCAGLARHLDMKRYDLPSGALARAKRALESVGIAGNALQLETLDEAW